jgi:hypothetical protein
MDSFAVGTLEFAEAIDKDPLMLIRRVLTLVLLTTALASTGCTYSTQPLSNAKTSMPDLRLLGTWELSDPDKPADKKIVVVDRKRDEPNVLRMFDLREKKTLDVFLTKVGEACVASIAAEENGTTKFLICKYELKDDSSLAVWGVDQEFFAAAVEEKRLKGTKTHSDMTIDETPESLRKFIEEQAAKCFSHEEPLVGRRMNGQ